MYTTLLFFPKRASSSKFLSYPRVSTLMKTFPNTYVVSCISLGEGYAPPLSPLGLLSPLCVPFPPLERVPLEGPFFLPPPAFLFGAFAFCTSSVCWMKTQVPFLVFLLHYHPLFSTPYPRPFTFPRVVPPLLNPYGRFLGTFLFRTREVSCSFAGPFHSSPPYLTPPHGKVPRRARSMATGRHSFFTFK